MEKIAKMARRTAAHLSSLASTMRHFCRQCLPGLCHLVPLSSCHLPTANPLSAASPIQCRSKLFRQHISAAWHFPWQHALHRHIRSRRRRDRGRGSSPQDNDNLRAARACAPLLLSAGKKAVAAVNPVMIPRWLLTACATHVNLSSLKQGWRSKV